MQVKISDIKIGERFRKEYTDIQSLADSIQKVGLLHPPVVDKHMNLIAGGRRLEALKLLGQETCTVTQLDTDNELGRRQAELIENIERQNLTWQEEVALKKEIDNLQKSIHGSAQETKSRGDWSVRKTAALLGESDSNTTRDINLADMLEIVPELASCGTKHEAQKKLAKLVEHAAMKELQERAAKAVDKTDVEQLSIAADNWYNVGDAIEGMDSMSWEGNNFVIAEVDPPYGIALHDLRQGTVNKYAEIDKSDYERFISTVAKLVYTMLNEDAWCVWWFGSTHHHTVLTTLRATGFIVDEIPAIWVKNQGQTNQPDKNFARAWEGFFLCRKGNPVMHKRGRLNVFAYNGVPSQNRIHPTERPVELILDIVQTLCPPGVGKILVPFLGSGNTLRAAMINGMEGIGWDIDGDETKMLFISRLIEDYRKLKGE